MRKRWGAKTNPKTVPAMRSSQRNLFIRCWLLQLGENLVPKDPEQRCFVARRAALFNSFRDDCRQSPHPRASTAKPGIVARGVPAAARRGCIHRGRSDRSPSQGGPRDLMLRGLIIGRSTSTKAAGVTRIDRRYRARTPFLAIAAMGPHPDRNADLVSSAPGPRRQRKDAAGVKATISLVSPLRRVSFISARNRCASH
jgi:hypothetical protein